MSGKGTSARSAAKRSSLSRCTPTTSSRGARAGTRRLTTARCFAATVISKKARNEKTIGLHSGVRYSFCFAMERCYCYA